MTEFDFESFLSRAEGLSPDGNALDRMGDHLRRAIDHHAASSGADDRGEMLMVNMDDEPTTTSSIRRWLWAAAAAVLIVVGLVVVVAGGDDATEIEPVSTTTTLPEPASTTAPEADDSAAPLDNFVGVWTSGGQTFTFDDATYQIEDDSGVLEIGTYQALSSSLTLRADAESPRCAGLAGSWAQTFTIDSVQLDFLSDECDFARGIPSRLSFESGEPPATSDEPAE